MVGRHPTGMGSCPHHGTELRRHRLADSSGERTACDSVAIGSMLDTVLTTFVSPLYDAPYNAGNYVLAKLEEAVRAYVDSDDQMGADGDGDSFGERAKDFVGGLFS